MFRVNVVGMHIPIPQYKSFRLLGRRQLRLVRHFIKMKILLMSVLMTAAWCYPIELDGYGHYGAAPVHAEPVAYPKYQFNYGVKDTHTGDIKEQSEERDGHAVKGEYSLVEPDGTIRKVEYFDDGHSGFNAIVHKSGHAQHPATAHKPAIPVAAHGLYDGYH